MKSQILTPCDTPILFIIFNRPNYTKKVFDTIKKAKPTQLFIAADGPHPDNPQDHELCKQTRAIINLIDWECEVKALFQDQKLGCGKGVSTAIDWFFDHVEQGIILEDDCVPNESFFPFCTELLEKYKNDESIMMISGTSYLFNKETSPYNYFFSRYFAIWGWATWKRAWKKFDFYIPDWRIKKHPRSLFIIFKNIQITKFWTNYFDQIKNKKLNAWSIQWGYTCIFNHGLAITPFHNLISNIGAEGVHYHNDNKNPLLHLYTKNIQFPLNHPPRIVLNKKLNAMLFKNLGITSSKNILLSIKKLLYLPKKIGFRLVHKIKKKLFYYINKK
ncbi:MAG: Nucleotide-diphospho-sugar transferase domain-containing protein [candidate division TM6 bacterium GW2011_GWF2_36_6]|nr:MAG: Nucleotide-diphospho-sugar transferase domain-containing protein [candidate division TM6 bacterium GW2011_GWF2_36_6]